MAIKWTDSLSVGVEIIDIQHKVLIDIVNELNDAVGTEKAKDIIPVIIEKLQAYAKFHFRTEEGYFVRFNCKDSIAHVAEHRRLFGKVQDFIDRYKKDSRVSVGELVFFLGDWIENHLKVMDQTYVSCFLQNGLQ